jgi:S-DNA-T family DNA segregation ATPase FtsK/SpoIIIE
MATWGPPRKRDTRPAGRSSGRALGAGRRALASGSGSAPAKIGDDAGSITGPTRRQRVTEELRGENNERLSDIWGIGLIAVGALLGLGIYLRVAGPVGKLVSETVAWVAGLGKFIVPAALIAVGVSLVRRGHSEHRYRLALGWGIIFFTVLGLLHVIRADGARFDERDAGGWLGLALGAPLKTLLGSAGAVIALLAVMVAGIMLVTQSSVRDLAWHARRIAGNTGRATATIARPLGRRAKRALGDMSTLRSDRDLSGEVPRPEVFDDAGDADWASPADATRARKGRAAKATPAIAAGPGEQTELDLGPGAQRGQWVLPPANLLVRSSNQAVNMAEVDARGTTLVESLASHGVETKLVGRPSARRSPATSSSWAPGVKVARVTSLNRDIAYAMAAVDVRILAPIPGRSAIGVEVPNHTRQLVSLGDIMTSPEAKTATHPLDVAIGKDIAGRSVFLNLSTTPHLLIAGTTGAGKSSGINCIVTSLLMRTTPEQVKPHPDRPQAGRDGPVQPPAAPAHPAGHQPEEGGQRACWAVKEMERRYDVLTEVGFRDITGYNAAYDRGELVDDTPTRRRGRRGGPDRDEAPTPPKYERLPYIVVVVDELNDLMMVAARDVEESITRIAQKARAVGIHLIVATQRPSVNVITGVIKANIPARMAFAVSSLTDSRVILDQPGAEKLVGKGDMLLLPGTTSVSQRIQGCFVSEEEVRKVVAHWRRQAPEVVYVSGVEGDDGEGQLGGGNFGGNGADDDEDEALMRQAMELVVRSQLGSTSMLQRKLKVGFARAGRVMDLLEQRGVVGPSEGSKARAVLMTVEEFELLQERGR